MCDSMCWEERSQQTQEVQGDEGHPPYETITIRLRGLARAVEIVRRKIEEEE